MNSESHHKPHRVPVIRFTLAVTLQLGLALALFSILSPQMFAGEVEQVWGIVGWTVMLGLPLSLFEYLYHRYLLHSAVLPFMASMHRAHSTHHSLTYVKAPVTPHEPVKLVEVKSEYPIEEEEQEESMMFPLYSLSIFYAIFLALLALPLKLLFPSSPVVVSLILAVTIYASTYEVWHAILHLPFERFWQPFLQKRWTKKMATRMYSFHLMHHWRPTSNLAIVGFWGVALWDYLFRTHRRPENLPTNGAEVNFLDAQIKKPLWPISMLDRWQAKSFRTSRNIEKAAARVFLGRKPDSNRP